MLPVVSLVTVKAKRKIIVLSVIGLQSPSTTELSSIEHGSVCSQGLVLRPFALRLFLTPLTNLHTLIYTLSFSV